MTADYSAIEARLLATENQHLREELGHAHRDIEMVEADNKALATEIIKLRNFIGKVQGVCLGVAMSDSHPNPSGALSALFNEAQDILFPPQPEPVS